jgi:hypothetical protein
VYSRTPVIDVIFLWFRATKNYFRATINYYLFLNKKIVYLVYLLFYKNIILLKKIPKWTVLAFWCVLRLFSWHFKNFDVWRSYGDCLTKRLLIFMTIGWKIALEIGNYKIVFYIRTKEISTNRTGVKVS